MGKNVVTSEQKRDAERLKAIYAAKAKALNLTQEKLGIALGGSGQSTASNYLNGITALNLRAAIVFARELQVPIEEFSPAIANELGADQASPALAALEEITADFDPADLAELKLFAEIIRNRKRGAL